MAFNTLQLEVAVQFVKKVLYYIPNIIVGIVLLVLGLFLGNFMRRFTETTCRLVRIPFSLFFSRVSQYVVIGLTLTVILEYMTPQKAVAVESLLVLFAVVPSLTVLIIFIGGRDILRNILAGRALIVEHHRGDNIAFDSIAGKIAEIGLITTKLDSGEGRIFIPNAELAKKIIKKE
jgi:small-conductance mechanosensitive channel